MNTETSTISVRYCGPACKECAVKRLETALAALKSLSAILSQNKVYPADRAYAQRIIATTMHSMDFPS